MIKVSFFFGFLCLMLMACDKKPNGPMTFEELTIDVAKGRYTFNDTIKKRISRVFIVDNFCFCPKDVLTFDSLFCTFVYDSTYSYSVGLFKKSEITNVDHLQKFPRDLDRHSSQNDRILSYIHKQNDYHFYRYDYYIDEVNILSIRNKFICNEGRAVPYTEGYK